MTNSNDALRAALGDNRAWLSDDIWLSIPAYMRKSIQKAHEKALTPSPVAGGDLRELVAKIVADYCGQHQWDDMANDRAQLRDFARVGRYDLNEPTKDDCLEAAGRILAALNQPAAPVEAVEPVAWMYSQPHPSGHTFRYADKERWDDERKEGYVETPLYAHPPEPAASTVARGDR